MTADKDWELEGLGAAGPHAELKDELMLFGQFVGDWEILESSTLGEDGSWSIQTGELHWRWILEGKAVQDVWAYHDELSGALVPKGTTLRFYDAERRAWQSVWITPAHHDVGIFIGKQEGGEIVLRLQPQSKHEDEGDLKWIFFDIEPDSFKWRAEESADGGKTWAVRHRMRIRRLPT